jgi:hypothetical protein
LIAKRQAAGIELTPAAIKKEYPAVLAGMAGIMGNADYPVQYWNPPARPFSP